MIVLIYNLYYKDHLNQMNNSKVSIIINCLNGEKFIVNCLQSILNQTYKNFEIIYWDNNSSDNSLDLVKKFKSKKVKIYKSQKTLKLYNARNKAISKANGKYIAFLDVDDTWHNQKIEKQVKKIENEKTDIVYTNHWIQNGGKNIFSNKKLPNKNMTFEILNEYTICISTVLLKTKIFYDINRFNKNYEIIGDYDLFFRISMKYKYSVIQEPLATYLYHSENTSKKKLYLRIKEFDKWLKNNSKNFKDKTYQNLFERLYQENRYLECNNLLIKKNYKLFFLALLKINKISIKIKLICKMLYCIVLR